MLQTCHVKRDQHYEPVYAETWDDFNDTHVRNRQWYSTDTCSGTADANFTSYEKKGCHNGVGTYWDIEERCECPLLTVV